MSGCHYCGTTERDLRPYGPGGSNVCLPCVEADPAREEAAMNAFAAMLDAAEATGGGPPVLTDHGVEPITALEDLPDEEV